MAEIKAISGASVHRLCSGQVVLNLASAVKELVENALDSGATVIEVRLREHGSELIEVCDNGSGITPENFEALTLRHHTSKIEEFSDLKTVTTFGFRGEALSSLSCISDLTITTRTADRVVGRKIEYKKNGEIHQSTQIARGVGTSVSVANIFKTLPVRYKEIKRNLKREYTKMLQVLQAYAIMSVNARIVCSNQVRSNPRTSVFVTKAGSSILENIGVLFGRKVANSLAPLEVELPNGGQIIGHVSKDNQVIGLCGERQFFYLNGRPVDLPKVARLLNDAFRSLSSLAGPPGKPIAFLNFIVPHESTDVNVTPDKRTVFLEDEGALLDALQAAAQQMWEPNRYTYAVTPIGSKKGLEGGKKSKLTDRGANGNQEESEPSDDDSEEEEEEMADASQTDMEDEQSENLKKDVAKGLLAHQNGATTNDDIADDGAGQSEDDVDLVDVKPEACNSGSLSGIGAPMTPPHPSSSLKSGFSEELGSKRPLDSFAAEKSVEKSVALGGPSPFKNSAPRKRRAIQPSINEFCTRQPTQPTQDNAPTQSNAAICENSPNPEVNEQPPKHSQHTQHTQHTPISPMPTDDPASTPLVEEKLDDFSQANQSSFCGKSGQGVLGPKPMVKKEKDGKARIDFAMEELREVWKEELENLKGQNDHSMDEDVPSSEFVSSSFQACDDKLSKPTLDSATDELNRVFEKRNFKKMQVIGQFNLGFILAKLDRDVFIVDQHASDEKKNFETLVNTTAIGKQPLVCPVSLNLSVVEESIVRSNMDVFEKNGFRFVDDPSDGRLKMSAIPLSKKTAFGTEDVAELAAQIQEGDRSSSMVVGKSLASQKTSAANIPRPSRVRTMLAMRACRSSIMIGTALPKKRMKSILENLSDLEAPWNCPHGRPTMRHLCVMPEGH
ncbi:hypothetical protein BSKO_08631 [Bryopsis sp. KO-2023]|nr:hypothetical protein BSKO_08631 [Bryopsis sp. KO-2023]